MKVTLNTSIYNNRQNLNNRKNNPSFSGGAVPVKSAFLDPFRKGMDKITDKIADYYSGFAFSNSFTNWLAKREKLDKIVGHMQTAGSIVISSMYMTQTLRNENLDEKRKKTLAINQGLTLLFSTLGAYTLDSKLANFWNKHVSMKYAANFLEKPVQELEKGLAKHRESIKALYIEKHPEDAGLVKFKKPNLLHYVEKGLKNDNLTGKLKGLDALKSLIVFGTVYRFIGPVAVTPFANMIGNKLFYAEGKNAKEQPQTASLQAEQYVANKPKLENFISKLK